MTQQEIRGHIFSPGDALVAASNNGRIVGEVAASNSTFGISGAATSVLNQNGYVVTQDDRGQFYVNKMYNSNPGNPNYFDQNLDLMPFQNSNASYPTYNGSNMPIVDSYARDAQRISDDYLAGLGSQNLTSSDDFTASDKSDLKSYEAVDPVTGKVVSKEKSDEIDGLLSDRATINKFEDIAKKINKTYDAQNGKADGKDFDATHVISGSVGTVGGIAGGAALGAKIGAVGGTLFGPAGTIVGGIAGAIIGGVAGFFAGDMVADWIGSYTEPDDIANDLESSINGLSDKEKVAFERYYNETYGQKIGNVLSMLEVDEDSSWEGQLSGLTHDRVNGILQGFDNASKNVLEFAPGEKDELENSEETSGADPAKKEHSLTDNTQNSLNRSEYSFLMNVATQVRSGRASLEEFKLPEGCSTLGDIEARLAILANDIETYNN